MRACLTIFLLSGLLAAPALAQQAPPATRPSTQPAQYQWDLICMAADNYWKINLASEITPEDDQIAIRLIDAAKQSGRALGKDFDTVADDLMPVFMGYLNDPKAYYGMDAGAMRAHCNKLLG